MLEKKDNETTYEYGLRIIQNKVDGLIDIDWQEIVELLGLDCHRDSLRKASNVTPYSGVAVAKYYQDKIEKMKLDGFDNSDVLNELDLKIIELKKERMKLQDQRRVFNAMIRKESKFEVLLDTFKNAVDSFEPTQLKEFNCDYNGEASLLLSDWHIGININTPHNYFNTDVALERINKLKDYTIKYCKQNCVKRLNVCILGDMISGLIHTNLRLENQENVINQVLICSDMLSQLVNELSKEIQEIVVHFTVGNHGRVFANMKEHTDEESFEYLILEFMKEKLKNIETVSFNDSKNVDKEIVIYKVFDKTIACIHGHKEKKIFDSVEKLSSFLGIKIDLVFAGHFHNFAVQNNVVVNSSFSGADEYANSIRFNQKASQTLVIHLEDGSQILHNILLN